jgi:AbrB family looped-hinge helix DNA binding protein
MDATLVLGRQGRLVLPAAMRVQLGLQPGDRLHLRVEGHTIRLAKPEDAASELRGLARSASGGRSLVDELLDERRRAAERGE